MNYQNICEEALQIIQKTAVFVAEQRKSLKVESISSKNKNDFVTQVDKESEIALVKGLGELMPESGFIAEEGTINKKGEVYNWIIDPIDGTTNFMHGAPPYSISVALQENNEIVIGIVVEISNMESFYSYKGGEVFHNGAIKNCSTAATVSDALIATGFPYTDFGRLPKFMDSLVYFMNNSHGVRRLGSAAVDLAYVAIGRYDAFYEYNLKAWDVAAGAFLIKQAGGKVGDFSGGDNWLFGQEIVAANGRIYSDFQKTVAKLMSVD